LLKLAKLNYLPAIYKLALPCIDSKRLDFFEKKHTEAGLFLSGWALMLAQREEAISLQASVKSINTELSNYLKQQADKGSSHQSLLAAWYLYVNFFYASLTLDNVSTHDFLNVAAGNLALLQAFQKSISSRFPKERHKDPVELKSIIKKNMLQGIAESRVEIQYNPEVSDEINECINALVPAYKKPVSLEGISHDAAKRLFGGGSV
jgi:hypothetical protein